MTQNNEFKPKKLKRGAKYLSFHNIIDSVNFLTKETTIDTYKTY